MKSWWAYFVNLKCAKARDANIQTNVEYGEVLYVSPELNDMRWLVTHYDDEFNVFVDRKIAPECYDRCFGASFRSKERAMSFALEMFLVCCGKLKRSNRYALHSC